MYNVSGYLPLRSGICIFKQYSKPAIKNIYINTSGQISYFGLKSVWIWLTLGLDELGSENETENNSGMDQN